ncbi:MAG: tRNA (adenosine(37)-N6)-threonylcarbamoyltransferase complex ATPase subunit type 1 TsaE [Gammaproteobacteria bacterium]|nr:tRNA (adenosine(37)-N6)-threonylcarbamoyltransferase complex ATPase subunit type 1 TsaE [Gammaproteobacteria bacterium]
MGALGMRLGQALDSGGVVYLMGELGAGKTTLVRGVLAGMGFHGKVRSPTYTLMENYQIDGRSFRHLDLYRIRQAEELEFLGVRELDEPHTWVFVEWPELGTGHLPAADLEVRLDFVEPGRRLSLTAASEHGCKLLEAWTSKLTATPAVGVRVLD